MLTKITVSLLLMPKKRKKEERDQMILGPIY